MFAFGGKKIPMPQLSTWGTRQKWMCSAQSPRIIFMDHFSLRETWPEMFICKCFRTGYLMSSLQMSMNTSFFNRMGLHRPGSWLYGLISMRIYKGDGLGVPVIMIMRCWNGHHVHLTWHLVIFFYGAMWKDWSISPSSYKPRGTQAENHLGAGGCYARHATACLAGAGLPTWRVSCHRWCAYWTFVKLCEIGYKIYIPLNFLFEFW